MYNFLLCSFGWEMKPTLPILVLFFFLKISRNEGEKRVFFSSIFIQINKTNETYLHISQKKKIATTLRAASIENSLHTNTYKCDQFLTRTSIIIFQLNFFFLTWNFFFSRLRLLSIRNWSLNGNLISNSLKKKMRHLKFQAFAFASKW